MTPAVGCVAVAVAALDWRCLPLQGPQPPSHPAAVGEQGAPRAAGHWSATWPSQHTTTAGDEGGAGGQGQARACSGQGRRTCGEARPGGSRQQGRKTTGVSKGCWQQVTQAAVFALQPGVLPSSGCDVPALLVCTYIHT